MHSESGTTSELVGVAMPRKAENSAKTERDKLRERMRGYGCTAAHLVDADDLAKLTPADRALLTAGHPPPACPTEAVTSLLPATAGDHTDPGSALGHASDDTGVIRGSRRLVRRDARGLPVCEEVLMAADESAQFHRWSATTNVDDDVLEQMTADVAELARREQIDPPATTYVRLLGARDDVFRLIAGQICAMLSIVTFDLGHPHAARTHARTALHCADLSGHTQVRVFIRWVQSTMAYWDGRYDEAAQLMEAALPDATSGTTLLRLASQQARINAARSRPDEVDRALALAATAPTERTPDKPGVLGFDARMAAFYGSEAHYAVGGPEQLNSAVEWARISLEEFTAETQPRAQYVATARFDLALAHLSRDELDAVGENLAPILHATDAEYRTVPIIGRARSLHSLLTQRADLNLRHPDHTARRPRRVRHPPRHYPSRTGTRHPHLTPLLNAKETRYIPVQATSPARPMHRSDTRFTRIHLNIP
ncbi:MAG: hypothetical protein ACT4NY_14995 [Pseudonocardiales bacterium]